MASKEFETVIEILRSRPRMADLSVEEQRAQIEADHTQVQLAQDVRCQPVDAGGVPAEWVTTPESIEGRVIQYLHGGAYMVGSIKTHREIGSRISRAAAAQVLLIDYRLAPENPFPAAVEDSVAAYRWLLSTGVNPAQAVIAGESAGGGLTVATLVALRDAVEPLPAAAVAISPWVDMEALGESVTTKAEVDLMVQREGILMAAEVYLGGINPRTPLASPIYADLTGLPPLLIQVGTSEVLLDDATRLAERARATGVDVVLETWADMMHVWHSFAAILPEAQQAIDRIGEFVREHTG
jgi:monoterpene epsilon-lactone hydrolase